MADLKICVICGSLRKESYNRMVVNTLPSIVPAEFTLKEAPPYDKLPHYNGDLQKEKGFPAEAIAWADAIRAADGVLFVSPEYNFSIPGPLKNMIDWVSRMDRKDMPFIGKPCAIMTAAPGPVGGTRLQYHLRQILVSIEAVTMTKPEVFITAVAGKVDPAKGMVTDETTLGFMKAQMEAFAAFIKRLS